VHEASHCGSKQQSRSPDEITLVATIRKYNQLFIRFASIVNVPHQDNSIGITILLLVCVTYMGVIFRAHPIRGESHIQRNANRGVATTFPPFYNEPHQSYILFVKSAIGTTFTSWSQHHFVAIRKPERQVRKASYTGSKQQ